MARLNEGDSVIITSGDLDGTEGVIVRYYPQQDVYSLRLREGTITDPTITRSPDGYFHWLAHRSEIEPINKTIWRI